MADPHTFIVSTGEKASEGKEDDVKKIGFIGVGSMGAPMARCVFRAGYSLTVCDKSLTALKTFREMGARVTDKPADCADQDMIIVMVANDSQVKEVVSGPEGFLKAVDPKRPPFLAIMSTILPQTTQGLAPQCAKKNVRLVDATVSGFPVVAETGKLTIMVGGEKEYLEAMRPVFMAMGENIYHTGLLGSGDVAKLVNNIVGITNLFLSAEAMLVGKKYGMDLSKMAAIMETSSGRNFSTKDWERGRANFTFFAQSLDLSKVLVDLCVKDLEHAQELAKNAGLACPLLDQIVQAVKLFTYEEIKERFHAVT
jgi:3-hydroxyisobutyrate dehydrogenase-like beta-hydroxyacid dehydrogenase